VSSNLIVGSKEISLFRGIFLFSVCRDLF